MQISPSGGSHHRQRGGFYQHIAHDNSEFIPARELPIPVRGNAIGRPRHGFFAIGVEGALRSIGPNEVISISHPNDIFRWLNGDLHHDNHARIYRVYTDPNRENKEYLAAGESDFDGTSGDSRTHSCTLTGSEFYITDEGVRTTDIREAGHFTPNPGSPIR